jgi:hypothetical protein
MAIPLSVFMLRRKRNEIRDAIANYELKLKEARADLASVLSTLRLFEASGEPADFAPYFDLNRVFRRGETTELCMAALAAEGPLDTRQLTERVMKAKGLNHDDKVMAQAIALRVVQTLRIRAKRRKGIDGTLRRRGVCVWRLTSEGGAANNLSTGGRPGVVPLLERFAQTESRSHPGDDPPATPFLTHTRTDNAS